MIELDWWRSGYHVAALLMSIAGIISGIILLSLLCFVPYRGDVEMAPFWRTLPRRDPYRRDCKRAEKKRPCVRVDPSLNLWIVKNTTMDRRSVVLSISDYCSIRGATTQSLLTAFGNIFSSIGIQASVCKICETDSGSKEFNAILCLILGLFGTMLLVNFEVNNQTTPVKGVVNTKFAIHLIGCFMLVILAPLGYGIHCDWDALSTVLTVIGYLSFGIYIIARALFFLNKECGWRIDFLKEKVGPDDNHDGDGDKNDESTELKQVNKLKGKGYQTASDENSSTDEDRDKDDDEKPFIMISDVNEKHRRRCSYFFCLIELISVTASGIAAIIFIYQM